MNESSVQQTEDQPEWIKKLAYSKFNYWGGYVANLILITALFVRGFTVGEELSLVKVLALMVSGVLLYTLTEYLAHRFLYHEMTSPFTKGHGMHHADQKGLLGLPWYFPYPVIIGAYFLLSWITGAPGSVGILMGAWWFGFVGYCAMHHSIHHLNFKSTWFRNLKAHHKVHHVREEANFGVLTTFWDRVFGTYFTK